MNKNQIMCLRFLSDWSHILTQRIVTKEKLFYNKHNCHLDLATQADIHTHPWKIEI